MAQVATQVQTPLILEPKVYELPEPGFHNATITEIKDLGIVQSQLFGERHQIRITLRIDDQRTSKDEDILVFQTCTFTLGEKSRLGRFLRNLNIDTGKALDIYDIVGMKILANIVHAKAGDKTYANIESVGLPRRKTSVDVI